MSSVFPLLTPEEIRECFKQMKIPFSEKISAESFKIILRNFVEFFTGKNFEEICQPRLKALKCFPYPELHEESVVFISEHRFLEEIFQSSGIYDFSLQDYFRINDLKIKKIFSGIINFAKFKEEKLFFLKKLKKITIALNLSRSKISLHLFSLKKKIFFVRKKVPKKLFENKSLEIKTHKNSNFIDFLFLEIFNLLEKNKFLRFKYSFLGNMILEKKKKMFLHKKSKVFLFKKNKKNFFPFLIKNPKEIFFQLIYFNNIFFNSIFKKSQFIKYWISKLIKKNQRLIKLKNFYFQTHIFISKFYKKRYFLKFFIKIFFFFNFRKIFFAQFQNFAFFKKNYSNLKKENNIYGKKNFFKINLKKEKLWINFNFIRLKNFLEKFKKNKNFKYYFSSISFLYLNFFFHFFPF